MFETDGMFEGVGSLYIVVWDEKYDTMFMFFFIFLQRASRIFSMKW